MNDLNRFRMLMAREKPDVVPAYASFTEALRRSVTEHHGLPGDADLEEFYGMYRRAGVMMKAPENAETPDFSAYYEGVEQPPGSQINSIGVLKIPANFYHFTGMVSPLRSAERFEEIESFPYPNPDDWSDTHMAGEVEAAHAAGRVAVGTVGHIYENAWQIRGYEPFLEDMMLRPEWCEFILDKLAYRNKKLAEAAARAGADVLHTGDDVANQQTLMFAPDLWRRFIKSRWAEVYEAARAIKPDIEIWYHSDGNVMDIIPELIDIGVTILNPVQPECMDPLEIHKRWGDKLALDGTIGTQTTMPFGTADEVRETVEERKRTLGQNGGLFLSPTHVLEPEVPVENVDALFETASAP